MNHPPRLASIAPTACAEEIAVIVAALERFSSDTAPERHPTTPAPSAWARAALLEATDHASGEARRPLADASDPADA